MFEIKQGTGGHDIVSRNTGAVVATRPDMLAAVRLCRQLNRAHRHATIEAEIARVEHIFAAPPHG